jgi:hypothetical protein
VRVGDDIHQPALAVRKHRRQPRQRRADAAIAPDHTHAPGAFGQDDAAVRQKVEPPRYVQAIGHDDELQPRRIEPMQVFGHGSRLPRRERGEDDHDNQKRAEPDAFHGGLSCLR